MKKPNMYSVAITHIAPDNKLKIVGALHLHCNVSVALAKSLVANHATPIHGKYTKDVAETIARHMNYFFRAEGCECRAGIKVYKEEAIKQWKEEKH